jgi:hypothetical protein
MLHAVYLTLIVLSIGGIAIMDFSPGNGIWYWLIMTAVFGAAATGLAGRAAHDRGESAGLLVRRQLLHWLTVLAGVALVFLLQWSLTLDPSVAGLIALLMLAVACVLAGIHFDWRLAVVGGVLAATFTAAVLAADFFWAGLLVAVIGGALLIFIPRRRRAEA